MCGEATTLADAKLQLRHVFDIWLGWAMEQQGLVQWHWTEAASESPDVNANAGLARAG